MVEKYFIYNDPTSLYAKKVEKINTYIDNLLENGKPIPYDLMKNSVNLLVLLQGKNENSSRACSYNCDICYTKDRFNEIGLSGDQIIYLSNEIKKLGAKALYIPGIGEPLESPDVWKYLENQQKEKLLPAIIFSNGSYLYDTNIQKTINKTYEEIIKIINENEIYQYIKFWTTDEKKAEHMYGKSIPYAEHNNTSIPLSLKKLLQKSDKNRIGVEVVIRKDNLEEVYEKILPFCEKEKIKCFIEPVIPVKWAPHVGLSSKDIKKLEEMLAVSNNGEYCNNRISRDLVVNIDTIVPCIVYPKKEKHKIIDPEGKVKNYKELFTIWHDKEFRDLRKHLHNGGCHCGKVINKEIKWE